MMNHIPNEPPRKVPDTPPFFDVDLTRISTRRLVLQMVIAQAVNDTPPVLRRRGLSLDDVRRELRRRSRHGVGVR